MAENSSSAAPAGTWIPYALAGLCASLVGIGLARFAYTPLLPALIEAHWFAETTAVYLGAANLAGYLAGALGGKWMATRISATTLLKGMMLLAAISFIACATPVSFTWYFIWRFAAGLAGGVLMVLAASIVLPHVPAGKRGVAGGIIFTGVGLGIALSGTLVPALIGIGLAETWLGLGGLSLVLTLAAWRFWPAAEPRSETVSPAPASAFSWPFTSLYLVYGLVAAGLVAHMIFLVDYVARGLGMGIHVGAGYWVLFGLGAALGPMSAGRLADTLGFKKTLRLLLALQAVAVALAFIDTGSLSLAVSSFVTGAVVPGVVPLIVGRVHGLSGNNAPLQRSAWSYATVGFSVGQAGAAYAFSYIFEITGRYDLLFQIGTAALVIALIIEFLTPESVKEASDKD